MSTNDTNIPVKYTVLAEKLINFNGNRFIEIKKQTANVDNKENTFISIAKGRIIDGKKSYSKFDTSKINLPYDRKVIDECCNFLSGLFKPIEFNPFKRQW